MRTQKNANILLTSAHDVHRVLCMQTLGKNTNTLTQRFVATGERIQSAIVHRTRPGLTSSQRAPRNAGAKHSLTKHRTCARARGHYTLCACPALALASGRLAVYIYMQGRRAVIVHYVCNCACTPHRFAIVLCLVHSHTHSTAPTKKHSFLHHQRLPLWTLRGFQHNATDMHRILPRLVYWCLVQLLLLLYLFVVLASHRHNTLARFAPR